MDKAAYYAIIMAALSDRADHRKITEHLHSDASRDGYNTCVLEILQQRDQPRTSSLSLETVPRSDMLCLDKPYVGDMSSDAQIARDFLHEFYQVKNCPSFLYHDAVLEKEDFDFLLELYSHVYGIRYSRDCGKYMQESLVEYARTIIRACKDKGNEQLLRDALE